MASVSHHDPATTAALLDALKGIAATPLEQAHAAPPGVYTSPDLFALEQARIFAREWLCPGLAAEIPAAGDYLTFSVGGQPIVVIRGADGEVRSFANVCRHRMMRLLEDRGTCQEIVCPYHAWTYDLEGRLVSAAHMKRSPGFDPKQIRLAALRTEVWEGWIYVTLNPEADSVARRLAPLRDVVARYDMAGYRPVVQQDHVWNTNWKLLTENFMEGYHLPVAHRASVGAWFPANRTRFPEERHAGFTYQTFIKSRDATYGRAHPDNTRLDGPWRETSVLPTVFPAHMYTLAPDHFWYLSLTPKSPDQVNVRFGAAVAPEVMAGLDDPEAYVADLIAFFDRVNAEDRFVVERVFRNVAAPLSRPGRLSWLEREIHDFICYLARRLADDEPAVTKQRAAGG